MAENRYFSDQTAEDSERERLSLLERIGDPLSKRHLGALGIQRGWRCLEIGAGHGSIAHWLAEQVAPQGQVVATDINPRFLTELTLPNVEVRRHDIRTDPLEPGTYDLAHCRAVLMHLPEPHVAVKRMVEALRIGGWLLIEEGDLSSIRAVDDTHPLAESFNRRNREILDRITQAKLFAPSFGPRVRSLLEEVELSEINNEGVTFIARGRETHARQYSMSMPALVAGGILSQTECADLQRVYSDPSFSFITHSTFAVWGKRAS